MQRDRDRLFRIFDLPRPARSLELAVLELVHYAFDRPLLAG